MTNMKIFRLFALLTLGLTGCMGFAYAQTPDLDGPKDSLAWNDTLHTTPTPYGRENIRIGQITWNPSELTWYVTAYDTVCDQYTDVDYFGFVRYTTSGTYTRHYVTAEDYDSIVTLHLIVKTRSIHNLPDDSGCDTYTWGINGVTYTSSQDILYLLPGIHNV